jgi:polyphosphate kinase 2
MKLKKIKAIETPYHGVDEKAYQVEKRRLQLELLRIQQKIIRKKQRLAIVFEGRDAAGKGSTIQRHIENIMPSHSKVVAFGIPTPKESKYWFRRYEKKFPQDGQIVFFDRSWYTRALIEPTMGYCTESQYKYFIKKVLKWEHKHIANDLLLVKFYLSIDKETQLYRFEDRLRDPLTFWKFSENDLYARKKWKVFTNYKQQMFHYTSSNKSPWVVVNANKKKEARLTSMLYLVRLFGNKNFVPLTGEDVAKKLKDKKGKTIQSALSAQQELVLKLLKEQESNNLDILSPSAQKTCGVN